MLKGLLSGLEQFQAIEIPLKMMKSTFYFMLKALFGLEIFTFLSRLFGYAEKQINYRNQLQNSK